MRGHGRRSRVNADNAMHIVLPLINPSHGRAAFPVARVMAKILSAPLHIVMATGAQPPMAQDLGRQISVPPDEPNAAVIEEISGDLVEAMIHRVNSSRQAMVILAVRFR